MKVSLKKSILNMESKLIFYSNLRANQLTFQIRRKVIFIRIYLNNCKAKTYSSAIRIGIYKWAKFFVPLFQPFTSNDYIVKDFLILLNLLVNKIFSHSWLHLMYSCLHKQMVSGPKQATSSALEKTTSVKLLS